MQEMVLIQIHTSSTSQFASQLGHMTVDVDKIIKFLPLWLISSFAGLFQFLCGGCESAFCCLEVLLKKADSSCESSNFRFSLKERKISWHTSTYFTAVRHSLHISSFVTLHEIINMVWDLLHYIMVQ